MARPLAPESDAAPRHVARAVLLASSPCRRSVLLCCPAARWLAPVPLRGLPPSPVRRPSLCRPFPLQFTFLVFSDGSVLLLGTKLNGVGGCPGPCWTAGTAAWWGLKAIVARWIRPAGPPRLHSCWASWRSGHAFYFILVNERR